MKQECPICKKQKENVGPKIIGSRKIDDPRFVQKRFMQNRVVMCEDCLKDYKEGKILIKPKDNTKLIK